MAKPLTLLGMEDVKKIKVTNKGKKWLQHVNQPN
jgi:hypothetical protein